MKKKGFTLAEVLITLGIIGVVAAITLPTLMQDARKQQLGTKLAKFANNTEKITRSIAVEGKITRKNIWEVLNHEMLFDTKDDDKGNKVTADLGSYVDGSSQPAVLRDNTTFYVLSKSTAAMLKLPIGTPSKYGEPALSLIFNPNIPGLINDYTPQFNFVITDKGFVFPERTDRCLSKIVKEKYKATKIYGIDPCCKDNHTGCDVPVTEPTGSEPESD